MPHPGHPWCHQHPAGSTATSLGCLDADGTRRPVLAAPWQGRISPRGPSAGGWWHVRSRGCSRRMMMAKAEGSGLTFNVTHGVCAHDGAWGRGTWGPNPGAAWRSWRGRGVLIPGRVRAQPLVGRGRAQPWGSSGGSGSGGGDRTHGSSEVTATLALAGQPVGGAQRRPVALVQPPHAVALIMDVVGDVLQVLQVGPAPGRQRGGKGIKSPSPLPPSPPRRGVLSPLLSRPPLRPSPDQQVPQEGELAVRRVLHCKARQSRAAGCSGSTSRHHRSTGTASRCTPPPPQHPCGQGCTHGCCSPHPLLDPRLVPGGARGSAHLR